MASFSFSLARFTLSKIASSAKFYFGTTLMVHLQCDKCDKKGSSFSHSFLCLAKSAQSSHHQSLWPWKNDDWGNTTNVDFRANKMCVRQRNFLMIHLRRIRQDETATSATLFKRFDWWILPNAWLEVLLSNLATLIFSVGLQWAQKHRISTSLKAESWAQSRHVFFFLNLN